jgi:carboxyl-terminal processing protease
VKSNRARFAFVLGSAAGLILLTALKAPILPPGPDPILKPLAIFTEVLNLTRSNYVEPVDVETLLQGAYDGVTDAIDPFSYYVPEGKMGNYRAFRKARAVDPGFVLGRRSGLVYVVAPIAGSPAAQAGFQSGDILLSVDGKTTRNEALWEVESRLAGPEGTKVSLKFLRSGEDGEMQATLSREAAAVGKPSKSIEDGVPVIRIPSFRAGTAAELENLLATVRGDAMVVLDVRDNPAGDVAEAARAASLLIPPGEVARVTAKTEPERSIPTEGKRVRTGAAIVLIDGGTAGAAEVFAGALHDRADAPLVGESSAGMGVIQKLVPMDSGGALYLTVAEYRTPAGTELTGKSLTPTERVDIYPGDTSGGKDPILRRALELAASGASKAA